MVYSVLSKKSFDDLTEWMHEIEKYVSADIKMFLIGNKCDDESRRQVTYEQGAVSDLRNERVGAGENDEDRLHGDLGEGRHECDQGLHIGGLHAPSCVRKAAQCS